MKYLFSSQTVMGVLLQKICAEKAHHVRISFINNSESTPLESMCWGSTSHKNFLHKQQWKYSPREYALGKHTTQGFPPQIIVGVLPQKVCAGEAHHTRISSTNSSGSTPPGSTPWESTPCKDFLYKWQWEHSPGKYTLGIKMVHLPLKHKQVVRIDVRNEAAELNQMKTC